jgi:DNA (cytosine-5)-methyltransferase 1
VRLLDLFCGAGGAAVGYHRAGFEIVGVDIDAQPNYPYRLYRGDALDVVRQLIEGTPAWPHGEFDAIHASPPCQRWTRAQNAIDNADAHPDLIAPLRPLLEAAGVPYVIENVVGAPLVEPMTLCGTSFGLRAEGFEVRRHRLFESNVPLWGLPCAHELPAMPVFGHSAGRDFRRKHGRDIGADTKRAGMGIDWMSRDEVSEAIPPAFTEFVGGQLVEQLARRAA